MCDVLDPRINGRIVNHQQTQIFYYSQFVLFQSTNLAYISKKVQMRIFPLVMREVTASRRDHAHHKVRIEANQPLYTMHSLLIFTFLRIIHTHHA